MGEILSNSSTTLLLDRAFLLPVERDLAHWSSKYVNDNPAYRWIVGKYVEADRPNRNRHMWSLEDLEASVDTVRYSPLNLLHREGTQVGAFVGADLIYPTGAVAADVNPYIEAVSAFWSHYFPNELVAIEKFHNEGSLFFSMECIGETCTFVSPEGSESEAFAWRGPRDLSYGEWGKNDANNMRINKPHFLAGALIFPPELPGWEGAEVRNLSNLVRTYEDEAESIYASVAESAPHLDSNTWESLMLAVMMNSHKSELLNKD